MPGHPNKIYWLLYMPFGGLPNGQSLVTSPLRIPRPPRPNISRGFTGLAADSLLPPKSQPYFIVDVGGYLYLLMGGCSFTIIFSYAVGGKTYSTGAGGARSSTRSSPSSVLGSVARRVISSLYTLMARVPPMYSPAKKRQSPPPRVYDHGCSTGSDLIGFTPTLFFFRDACSSSMASASSA